MLICIRDLTAAHLLRSASPATYLPSFPPPCHFSLCSHGPGLPLVPACFKDGSEKKNGAAKKISSERTPISDHTGGISEQERGRWEAKVGQAPFYKHGEGREVRVQVSVCTCVPERGLKWATNCFIYTADKHPNTSISWETQKHRGTTDAIILWNKNAK